MIPLLLVVLTIAFIVFFKSMLNRVSDATFKSIALAAAVQGGVIFWYCANLARACVINHFQLIATSSLNIIFVMSLIAGLIWLIKRPGKEPILFLIIFQTMSVIMNSAALMSLSFESESEMVVASMIFRTLAIYLLIKGFTKVKKV